LLLNAVPAHSFTHVRRADNARADALANEALDAEAGPSQPA
jgi:ribonuclease HI